MKFNSKLDDAVVDMLANDIAEKLGCEPAYDKKSPKSIITESYQGCKINKV
ncbi:MAG: hypothetical protein L6V80_06675 [Bacteroidales bacterium]|nr:MAG: hypothetical protein L6V80_06675 [Bacteroidales bacterium]